MKENILFICAHNDDQIIGGGGTFATYAKEGKQVKTVIFSYGEKSHPLLKRSVIVKTRIDEAKASDRILGGKELIFLGLNETKFATEIPRNGIKEKIIDLINKDKPTKIFTHSVDDPHPDHQEVHKLMAEIAREKKLSNVYTFDIWNPLKLLKRNVPKLVVDITDTFNKKMQAYEAHESQANLPGMLPFRLRMRIDALINGFSNHCRYAEIFHKL